MLPTVRALAKPGPARAGIASRLANAADGANVGVDGSGAVATARASSGKGGAVHCEARADEVDPSLTDL